MAVKIINSENKHCCLYLIVNYKEKYKIFETIVQLPKWSFYSFLFQNYEKDYIMGIEFSLNHQLIFKKKLNPSKQTVISNYICPSIGKLNGDQLIKPFLFSGQKQIVDIRLSFFLIGNEIATFTKHLRIFLF